LLSRAVSIEGFRVRLLTRFPALALVLAAGSAQVTTSQYDNARTGANLHETVLTPRNVNAASFGKVFTLPVDGDIYAQPLYFPQVPIPGKGLHNVLVVATEHDSVYAFDADGGSTEPLWHTSFLKSGVTTLTTGDVACPFVTPEIGITSTPVIDGATGTIYVLARTKESSGLLGTQYVQRLHALAITTGVEKFGGPVEIQASVPGRGAGSSNGQVKFNALRDNPRAALLLTHGGVYLSFASFCDVAPYHGWVMAYDAGTLKQRGVFNVSPDAEEGGIWLGDTGPAADEQGNIYVPTGNGKFDAPAGRDYGDSVLKLRLGPSSLDLADFFTPFNQRELNAEDNDIGSGGPVLLPDHLLVVAGKGGTIYLLDRDHLGKFNIGDDRHAVQTIRFRGEYYFGAPAYWNGHVFSLSSNDWPRDLLLDHRRLTLRAMAGGPRYIDPGATPTVSANGVKDGVLWILASKGWRSPDQPAVLHAYDASDITKQLYTSDENRARDQAGRCLRFAIPTVVNGRVYVGAKREVDVYGLLKD